MLSVYAHFYNLKSRNPSLTTYYGLVVALPFSRPQCSLSNGRVGIDGLHGISGLKFYVCWETQRGDSIPFSHNRSGILSREKDVLWNCPDRSIFLWNCKLLPYVSISYPKDNMVNLFCFMADGVSYIMWWVGIFIFMVFFLCSGTSGLSQGGLWLLCNSEFIPVPDGFWVLLWSSPVPQLPRVNHLLLPCACDFLHFHVQSSLKNGDCNLLAA